MPEISLLGHLIPYTITRARRRSISAAITSEGALSIKAPFLIPEFVIRQFLKTKAHWIVERVEERQLRLQSSAFIRYENGEHIHFFDKLMLIIVTESDLAKKPHIYPINNTFQVILRPGLSTKARQKAIKTVIHAWYKNNIKDELEKRVLSYAEKMGLSYNTIRVKDVSSHWGSCSVHRNLNFNYRLAMLPVELADYVIVHELCHLREMNHSSRFWELVEEVLPDYKQRRRQLKRENINVD